MWADGFGKVVVNDPEGASLILSLVDPGNPIRVRQGCAALDLVRSAVGLTASSNPADLEDVRDGVQSTGWTAAGTGEEWIAVDFGRRETVNVVSLRSHPRAHQHSCGTSVRVDVSDDGRSWSPAGTFPISEREGTDLVLGETTTRHLRATFAGLRPGASSGSRLSIHALEVYRYRRP